MTEEKKKKKKSITIPLPSSNNFMPILIVVSIGLAFLVGIMWQKVQNLESGSGTKVAGTAGAVGANNPQAAPQAPPQAGEVAPVTEDDYIKGNRNSRIALIEYSDTECPFCKRFHPTAQQAVDEYSDDVMWVYRHFPLEQIHSKAPKQAEALECAGKLAGNEGFWVLTDKIFEVTPSNNGLDNSTLPDLAAGVGINKSAFQTCLDSGEMASKVDEDYQSGLKAGVTGTPGNILLDTETGESILIPGAVPYPQVKQAIDDMLSKS
ncbi:MAG: DsbA family protein [Candidatus Sifarchaeia archaeon]|jgi:protein-disulfide isomerase